MIKPINHKAAFEALVRSVNHQMEAFHHQPKENIMPRISPSADEEQRLDRLAAAKEFTCKYCASIFPSMSHLSAHEDYCEDRKRMEAKYVACSYCNERMLFTKRNDHKCPDLDKAVEREALPYSFAAAKSEATVADIIGDALAERTDQNMITIPATLLTDVMDQQQKLTNAITEHNTNALVAKLYECVASHYENSDRIGAEAILNAIGYAQQSS